MHIFSATMTANPGVTGEARELTVEMRDVCTAAMGIPVSAWAAVAGCPYGTFGLSARLEGTAQLLEAFAKLEADGDWTQLVKRAKGVFHAPSETSYSSVIAATTEDIGQPSLVSITKGRLAPGHVQAGLAGAGKMLEFVKAETGVDGLLTLSAEGPMNEVSWLFGVESGAQGDAADAALASNPGFLELMDEIGPHFAAGGEKQLIARI